MPEEHHLTKQALAVTLVIENLEDFLDSVLGSARLVKGQNNLTVASRTKLLENLVVRIEVLEPFSKRRLTLFSRLQTILLLASGFIAHLLNFYTKLCPLDQATYLFP